MTFDFSTFSAISELFVTAGVLYVIITNMRGQPFKWRLALVVIVFEFSVNMLYMMHRMQHVPAQASSRSVVLFAALHGSLSLLVFLAFAVLCSLAYVEARKGKAYFAEHRKVTWVFIVLWMLSVGSGEVLYFLV